jgi:hypothetical protein
MKYIKKLLPPAVLLAILLFVFARTLGSYFLEDDFGEVCYCSNILKGHLDMLLSNFTGNYMQIPGMNVYRPCLLLSLLFDYALWRTNAYGYFLTNMIFMFGAAYMLYMVLRTLTVRWRELESFTASLCSAALFIANPLHSEAVSLVVGRVDIICAFFYLLSYWCLIKRGSNSDSRWTVGGIAAFWVAILTKEMAIGLPVLLFATAFIRPELFLLRAKAGAVDNSTTLYSLKDRFEIAIQSSLALWVSTVIYFVIRFLALGTLTGGYVGGAGASQLSHLVERWTELGTVERILFPLNIDVFGQGHLERFVLAFFYFTLTALLICRSIFFGMPWRWLALMLAWIVTTLIPVYQLWGLSENLEGSRFLFFLTLPLSALMPILICAPQREGKSEEFSGTFTNRLLPATATVFVVFVMFSSLLSYKNNVPWLHAGKQTRACQREAAKLANQMAPNKKAILLGIPKERGGAHMILNGVTFDIMLSPPYFPNHPEQKFLLFEPFVFGHPELINSQRLKECLSDPNTEGIYVWNERKLAFDLLPKRAGSTPKEVSQIDIPLPNNQIQIRPYAPDNGAWRAANDVLTVKGCDTGFAAEVSPLSLNPYDFDFVEFDLRRRVVSQQDYAQVLWAYQSAPNSWRDQRTPSQRLLPAASSADFQHCRLPLSNHWSWLAGGDILRLQIRLPAQSEMQLKDLRIISGKHLVPLIHIKSFAASNLGFYNVPERLDLSIDAGQVDGCRSVQLQISKPNFFFQDFAGSQTNEAIMRKLTKPGQAKDFSIANSDLPSVGYYQLRAVCLDSQGNEIGEPSSETTLYKSGQPL